MSRTFPRTTLLFLAITLTFAVLLPAAAQQGEKPEAPNAAAPGSAERAKQMADELERERLKQEQAGKTQPEKPAEAVQPAPPGVGGN
ncbi:MAG: hypothetical protein JSW10_10280 [Pseudomonadota bacterium]|nr:MAG: hypothetical protein JSW10_10280 [Pseudomonadota bacterium]